MQNVTENRAFMTALMMLCIGTFMLASETFPLLNKWMELVPLVDDTFRWNLVAALVGNAFISVSWDRLMQYIFLPAVIPYMKFTQVSIGLDWIVVSIVDIVVNVSNPYIYIFVFIRTNLVRGRYITYLFTCIIYITYTFTYIIY